MDYATEWKPLPLERRNTLCAGAMGWRHETRNDYTVWLDRDGKELSSVSSYSETPWAPCTDRNHTAMMVEEVVDKHCESQLLSAIGEAIAPQDAIAFGGGYVAAQRPITLLLIPPDLLSWAAWSALTAAKEEM